MRSTPIRMAKLKLTSVGQKVEKLDSLCIAVGTSSGAINVENSTIVPQKFKHCVIM